MAAEAAMTLGLLNSWAVRVSPLEFGATLVGARLRGRDVESERVCRDDGDRRRDVEEQRHQGMISLR